MKTMNRNCHHCLHYFAALKQVEMATGHAPTLPLLKKTEQKLPALTADALQLGAGLDSQADLLMVITQLLQPVSVISAASYQISVLYIGVKMLDC